MSTEACDNRSEIRTEYEELVLLQPHLLFSANPFLAYTTPEYTRGVNSDQEEDDDDPAACHSVDEFDLSLTDVRELIAHLEESVEYLESVEARDPGEDLGLINSLELQIRMLKDLRRIDLEMSET